MMWHYKVFRLLFWPVAYSLNKVRHLLDILHNPTEFYNHWTWPTSSPYPDDGQRLAKLWQEPTRRTIYVISIDVHAWDLDQSKITDIGLSIWYPNTHHEFDIRCFHWRIKENMSLLNRHAPNEPDTFTFGGTEFISETDIAANFEHLFSTFAVSQNVVIVGHRINLTMRLLKNHWKPPNTMTLLDTQNIWQLQHQRLDQVTLEKALKTTLGVVYQDHLLHNAGNDAQFVLLLLQAQGLALLLSKH
ncbi:uncharacterized protein GGS25DRAFT_488757 [Hypoxylon fragiforme]|uniref:uncharacterized protein n=1 Tax=Hypoxylon fragiforme TaxID=63214 RepID=UPI0020C6D10A|nr:uncharacterized protein GGS25DRAFT_488757 [Hypoxylon fragiforme]KAI2608062.1 hypothetical protein GGS25DRAFT_488757 [Hypoxylon fragiforme]